MKTIKRRRKENKTDYAKRLKLLKGETPRLVIRKTNRYIVTQYVSSEQTQDRVELTASSKDLIEYGWPKESQGSLKSTPAAYLTGLLMGKKIVSEKKETPIIDFGMMRILHKTRIFSVLKGVADAGVKIKYDEKTFPKEDRIMGKHLKKDFSKKFDEIKTKIKNG